MLTSETAGRETEAEAVAYPRRRKGTPDNLSFATRPAWRGEESVRGVLQRQVKVGACQMSPG